MQKKNIDNLKDEDMVKLALLYFLEHFLLGKEGKNLIDMQWVGLVIISPFFGMKRFFVG